MCEVNAPFFKKQGELTFFVSGVGVSSPPGLYEVASAFKDQRYCSKRVAT